MKPISDMAKIKAMLGFLTFFFVSSPVHAEIVGEWADGMNSRARLVAGTIDTGNIAGLEITLTSGWKTYWRNPGDGGIAPEFSWLGSENVRNVSVLYPFPKRYQDNYGTAIGYKNNVVFPVQFEPIDPMKPQTLRVRVEYAVCEALCIPAEADLELHLPGGVSFGSSPRLLDVVAQVPRAFDNNVGKVVNVVPGDGRSMIFDVQFAEAPIEAEVFVEGPTNWFIPAPEEVQREVSGRDTVVRYRLNLSHLPKDATMAGETFLFSIKSNKQAAEQSWLLN